MTNPSTTKTQTMTAYRVESADAPFLPATLARPAPEAGQVLVRVHASGANPLDTKIRAAKAPHARQPLPAVLGLDMAGVVEAVGAGVTGFKPGDEVYGMVGGVGGLQGTLADYVAADATLMALKPANLTMRDAAALPLVLVTAWQGLVDRAAVSAGQRLLVIGAGGVGHIAVQVGLARGAQVYAVDRADKADAIIAVGAKPISLETPVADYVAAHTDGAGFDVVYDTVGGPGLDAAFQAVRRYGHVVSSLGWGAHALAPLSFKEATYSGVFTLQSLLDGENRAQIGHILQAGAQLADAGKLQPQLDPRSFGPADAADIHQLMETGQAQGKLVMELVTA